MDKPEINQYGIEKLSVNIFGNSNNYGIFHNSELINLEFASQT